ncbi:MAG: HisA/HisF-related TIM barrel protein [Candidatus Methanospirareceae archaeon]
MDFRVIFVMDVLDGVVVHGERGERSQYKPIAPFSSVVSSSDPLQVIDEIKPAEVYIADLNRLMKTGDNRAILKEMRDRDTEVSIMLDYGVKRMEDLKEAVEAELADTFVLGTETASMDLIEEASESDLLNEERISVSIDLFNKEVLTSDKRLKIDPLFLVEALNEYPIEDVIVLDLDRVGTKRGVDFDFLARAVAVSEHDILSGGGIRGYEDIVKMEEIGVKGALVATALHDGSIPVSTLRLA